MTVEGFESHPSPSLGPTALQQSSLKHRSVRAGLWSASGLAANQVVSLITTMVLARLLAPSTFGLIGMAMPAMQLLAAVSDLGLSQALIQRASLEERHRSSAFWANVAFAVILAFLIVATTPLIALFFREPILQPILSALSLAFILSSLGTVHLTLLQKDMDFRTTSIIDLLSLVVYGLVGVTLAFWGWGVWSLVAGSLFKSLFNSVLLWLACRWRPRFVFDRKAFAELFGFSANLVGNSVARYVGDNIGDVLTGRYLGASALAFYGQAVQMTFVVGNRLSSMLTRVMFPAFSTIQNENEKLSRGYLHMVRYTSVVAFPISIGMLVTAPEFIRLIYGPRWMGVLVPLQILVLGGCLSAVAPLSAPVVKAKGRSDILFMMGVLTCVLRILLTIIGLQFGIVGICWADSLTRAIVFSLGVWIICKLIDLPVRSYWRASKSATVASLFMGLVVTVWRLVAIAHMNELPLFLSSVGLGIIVYVLALFVMQEKALIEMFQLLLETVRPATVKISINQ